MKKLLLLIIICCFINGCIPAAMGFHDGYTEAKNRPCNRDKIHSFTQTRGGIKDVEHRLYYNIPCDPKCKGYLMYLEKVNDFWVATPSPIVECGEIDEYLNK